MAEIRIGTSNIVVPGNKSTFPEAFRSKSRLQYYSSIFNTVELNRCFYKTPLLSTYKKWVLNVPADFQFSLKLSKAVTHVGELRFDLQSMDKFMTSASGTGIKKGCLLIQFPGKITLDYFEQVEHILHQVEVLDPDHEWRKAVEFRHPSWYCGETDELLDDHHATMVLHDIPKAKLLKVRGKSPFIYIRFHGPEGDYRGSYSNNFLQGHADQMEKWCKEGKDVYAYFNNTIGSAYENAIQLKKILNRNGAAMSTLS